MSMEAPVGATGEATKVERCGCGGGMVWLLLGSATPLICLFCFLGIAECWRFLKRGEMAEKTRQKTTKGKGKAQIKVNSLVRSIFPSIILYSATWGKAWLLSYH